MRLFHPLCGADLPTLTALLARHPISLANAPPLLTALAAAVLRLPSSLAEHLYVTARRARRAETEAPVFIVGHWRSGTTHLYNIMSKAPHWGYVSPFATALPWDFLLLGKALAPLLARALPRDRFIDAIPVTPDSPQEDEIALANMTGLSFYHALYFPRRFAQAFDAGVFFDGVSEARIAAWTRRLRYFYDKLSINSKGARLLIKNPVYTARIGLLRRIWPRAQFIHIHRNPYEVFVSMRNFYKRLFEELALEPYGQVDVDGVILATYRRMMDSLTRELPAIPDGHFVELSYDALRTDPLGGIAHIYSALALPGYEEAKPRFSAYLASIERYRQNTYAYPDYVRERVAQGLKPFIERWSYAPPA